MTLRVDCSDTSANLARSRIPPCGSVIHRTAICVCPALTGSEHPLCRATKVTVEVVQHQPPFRLESSHASRKMHHCPSLGERPPALTVIVHDRTDLGGRPVPTLPHPQVRLPPLAPASRLIQQRLDDLSRALPRWWPGPARHTWPYCPPHPRADVRGRNRGDVVPPIPSRCAGDLGARGERPNQA